MLYFLVSVTMMYNGELFTYTMDVFQDKSDCETSRWVTWEENQPADNQQYVCVGLPKANAIEFGLY